ncbi:MAG: ElyC/SanA/YdcF family protein [Patescibacteria group bacterium]
MNIFIVCGYGIPKDIKTDENYRTYLNIAFNRIYSHALEKEAVIIPCGGSTATEPPYEGTEAAAIGAYIQEFMSRAELENATEQWQIVLEDESLSTLENLLFAKRIIEQQQLRGPVTVFCEESRQERILATAHAILGSDIKVESIDFDISKNRYLDPKIIRRKEQAALLESLWTLEKPERLELHHEFFARKFTFFRERQAQGMSHTDVVTEWYNQTPQLLKELMPDHPLLEQFKNA